MKLYFTSFAILISVVANSQSITKRALFLGNSYIGVENLPQMIANVAKSVGDTLIFQSNTPDGYKLQSHSTDPVSISAITSGGWDYVILQEQSQLPAFSLSQVEEEVFPYARFLDSLITETDKCTETVFYMTWGRQNGDAANCPFWPPVCTYEGMDSLLHLRYKIMAEDNDAIVSPVGAVRRYLRENHPDISLYQSDGSHPSLEGAYAAACCFYTTLYRKDPTLITFDAGINATIANIIREATKQIVYDDMSNWYIGKYDPVANFAYDITDAAQVNFTNNSSNSSSIFWNFGDGTTDETDTPIHTYTASGTYDVSLIATNCGLSDTTTQMIDIEIINNIIEGQGSSPYLIYPNPASKNLFVQNIDNEIIKYKIIAIDGKVIVYGNLNNDNSIDISGFANGIYYLELSDGKRSVSYQKFLKD